MPLENWNSIFNNEFLKQFKRPELESAYGFNPNSAFGANMVPRSNLFNPITLSRDISNAKHGLMEGMKPENLLSGTSEGVANTLGQVGTNMAPGIAGTVMGRLTGSPTVGDAATAATSLGVAGAQGFANPVADASALISALKALRLF